MDMRNLLHIPVLLLWCALLMTSCNKDDLDLKPLSQISDASVWSDPALTETFVNYIYSLFSIGNVNEIYSGLVDEVHDWNQYADFNKCIITTDGIPNWRGTTWNGLYLDIRACNLFFEKIDQVPFDNTLTDGKTLKDRLMGEVHFLRAYFYYHLTSYFGGVPIITKAYKLDDEFKVERNTYSDCIKFIADECDLAASLLPTVQSGVNRGRATKGAALALKSRVLLYAASDLHNTSVFPSYAHPELIGYTDGNRSARWQAAKDAAKAVIDMGVYSLFRPNPAPGDSVTLNFIDLFLTRDLTVEDIFLKFYVALSKTNNTALRNGPNGWHCYGHNTPCGDLVDDYEMRDGTSFSWLNPVHAAAPYKSRDPRFYSSILYEGAYWKPRPADIAKIDPVGVVQVGTWNKWDAVNNKMVQVFGLDSRKSAFDNWNAGYTGYYSRKFIDPKIDGQYYGSDVPTRFIRYAEVLLNYAEACIELGQEDEARTYLNMIRKRAGMPDITESGAALRDRCRHERRIELALEDHRFFDVRRWVIGPAAYHPVSGVQVLYPLNPDNTTATIPTITPYVIQQRSWINKAYFLPLLRAEMNKNDLLIQNPDY
jgi:hypothetical protein